GNDRQENDKQKNEEGEMEEGRKNCAASRAAQSAKPDYAAEFDAGDVAGAAFATRALRGAAVLALALVFAFGAAFVATAFFGRPGRPFLAAGLPFALALVAVLVLALGLALTLLLAFAFLAAAASFFA